MVKLAQTIGATGIAQSTRELMNLNSHVIEVRQNLYSDVQERTATRVWPWTDIQYAGAEVAGNNSVIASCYVPIIAGVVVDEEQAQGGLEKPFRLGLKDKVPGTGSYAQKGIYKRAMHKDPSERDYYWIANGFGMSDYLFGISPDRSIGSCENVNDTDSDSFSKARNRLYTPREWVGRFAKSSRRGESDSITDEEIGSVDGTAPMEILQFESESDALDMISAYPARMIIGFVMGPRDVKLYYTETAIGMMVRRMRRIVESLGPRKPTYYPIGLGHLTRPDGDPWRPSDTKGESQPIANVQGPAPSWDCGAVQYKAQALRARGSLYIPWDQTPYSTMRRNFKYNHIMTMLGREMVETMQAIGIDMNDTLLDAPKTPFHDNGMDTVGASLQMLFASMFGTTTTHNATSDFTVDEASVSAGVKDKLGMLFNSGHIHVDPGVFMYTSIGNKGFFGAKDGQPWMLSSRTGKLKYKGTVISPETLYKEFIAKYLSFCVAAQCLESYFAVPLYQCHWLYVGSPKPEYVTEQLQMNFRSDVYFDGDNSLPFTLIPSRLNPGEVLSRVPCLMDFKKGTRKKEKVNLYLGVRDPLPYGPVIDIRYAGDRPLTTTEEREYTFTPIIEADASVQTQYRNSRTITCAVWPRPSVYSPGATRVAGIYGMLSDNSSVGGHYFYQPLTGVMLNPEVTTTRMFRSTSNVKNQSAALSDQYFKGYTGKTIRRQQKYWNDHMIAEANNPQMLEDRSLETPPDDEMVWPTLARRY